MAFSIAKMIFKMSGLSLAMSPFAIFGSEKSPQRGPDDLLVWAGAACKRPFTEPSGFYSDEITLNPLVPDGTQTPAASGPPFERGTL